jgi:3-hydroxyisobutyrate dehydrogenase
MSDVVAVLGAGGMMGLPMARNMARAGLTVRAWNRTAEKAEPLTEDGVTVCGSPAEAAEGAAIVVTMLGDADAVLAAAGEALGAGPRLWLQMSTLGIEGTERCAALADEHGAAFVDAPVLGTVAPAEKGELVVLASGPEDVRERADAVFDAVGKRTVWAGEAGTGSRLKLCTNTWILAVVEGAAETLALAEGIGVEPAAVLDALSGGPLDLPYLQMKGSMMIERDFPPSFKLSLAAKDAGLVADAAQAAGLDLPLVEVVRDQMRSAAEEHGDKDLAATFLVAGSHRGE